MQARGNLSPGLSPRVRGNRPRRSRRRVLSRSIPACAGEPFQRNAVLRGQRVYPRVCGGTPGRFPGGGASPGLSPRVRGNLIIQNRPAPQAGSIPACAGEPRSPAPRLRTRWVYPRVCGGTCQPLGRRPALRGLSPRVRGNPPTPPYRTHTHRGLSPRVRGNRIPRRRRRSLLRSIPACAGEPQRWWGNAAPGGVYPRVCGGTLRFGCRRR